MTMMYAVPMTAFAETPADGKITINSPIMGAKYYGYQIFDMSMNGAQDSFSYTISKSSKFYDEVKKYADVEENGLTLVSNPSDTDTFSISIDSDFDAQQFGKAMEKALYGDDSTDPAIADAKVYDPTYESGKTEVTVAKSDAISFENLPYGYYLIHSEYPDTVSTVTIKDAAGKEYGQITKNSTAGDKKAIVDAYVTAQTTDDKIQAYINEKGLKDQDSDGNEIAIAKDSDAWKKVKDQLEKSTTKDANLKIEQALNQIAGSEADDNTLTQRMVFVDSTTPTAVINEKNEQHKWDVPVNPTGEADLEGLPEHGEPDGGKNIIIKEATDTTPAVYADWTEANIGDSIHYQLSINATNFERDDQGNVKQIKEYILADYENKNMEFDADKKLMVTIVKKDANGKVSDDSPIATFDYTKWKDKFFKNSEKADLADGTEVLTTEDGGLAISWIEEVTAQKAETRANVTTTVVDKVVNGQQVYKQGTAPFTGNVPNRVDANGNSVDDQGYLLDKDRRRIKDTETHYWASKYPNDVTILVDYYMTLKDTATIDGNGNVNTSQYGVNYVEPTDKKYEPVKPDTPDDRKPTSTKDKDTAKVYTYALALHKVDPDKKDLAGAKFKALGLTVTEKAEGWYKVKKYDKTSITYGDEMATDSKGLLVIEGLTTSDVMTIMETVAPDGYNKLTETISASATKLSEAVTTTAKETYFDEDGNVIETKSDAKTTTTVVTTIENLKKAAIEIVNNKGTELPSTGGIGTTIFYVVGALLVLGAGVLLVTRRRARANEQ